jgi:hypothetical protein
MVICTFIFGAGAVVDGEKGTRLLVVGSKLCKRTGENEYVHTGTVTAIENAGQSKFGIIRGLNVFVPHESSPIDSSLEVGMVHADAWKVTVDFINPNEQIFSIRGVNVRI